MKTFGVPTLQAVTVMVGQVSQDAKENKGVIYLNMEVGDVNCPVEMRPKPIFEGDTSTGFTYRRLIKFLDENVEEFDSDNMKAMAGKRFVIPSDKQFDFPGFFFVEPLGVTMVDTNGRKFSEVRGVCIGVRAKYEKDAHGNTVCVQEAVGESPRKVVERLAKKFGWLPIGGTADAGSLEDEDGTVMTDTDEAEDEDSIEAQMARLKAKLDASKK